jgi:hypothetical protein
MTKIAMFPSGIPRLSSAPSRILCVAAAFFWMQVLLLQMEDIEVIRRSRRKIIYYCDAFRHKPSSTLSSFPVFSFSMRDLGDNTITNTFHNQDIDKSVQFTTLHAHSANDNNDKGYHQQQRRAQWRPNDNYRNGVSKVSVNYSSGSNPGTPTKYSIVSAKVTRKRVLPTKTVLTATTDWLFHMNTILSRTEIGKLDPTKLPYREVMNNWAKTRSTEGAVIVEELWLQRLQKEVEMGNSMIVVGKDIYTIAIDAWAKR